MFNKKMLSFLMVIVFLFTMLFSKTSYAEVLSKSDSTGNLTAKIAGDDKFKVYLSTTSSILGNETPTFTSDEYWANIESFSADLSSIPQKYYLLIECINYSGPGGIIGKFTLNGTGYTFANGSTILYTDTVNWQVSKTGFVDDSYTTPVGANDFINNRYDYVRNLLDSNAQWIWNTAGIYESNTTCYFIAEIIPSDVTPPVITIEDYIKTPVSADITVNASTNEGKLNTTSYTFKENGSFEFVATDEAGNISRQIVNISNIDKTVPEITIGAPLDGATYILNEKAYASWDTADYESGLANSNATTADGIELDTSIVGMKTFTVTATDNAGNQIIKTVSYNVINNFGGVLQPINSDGSSIFKIGSTLPVKFQLRDGNNEYVTNSISNIYYAKVSNGVSGNEVEAVSTSAASSGNTFRYDTESNQYIFNLSTKGWSLGTYLLTIKLNDGTTYSVQISTK